VSTNQPADPARTDTRETKAAPAYRWGRRIGPWGTTTRLVAGAAAVAWALAVPHAHPLFDLPGAGSRLWGSVVGLVLLPALLTVAVALRGRSARPLRLGHGHALVVTVAVVLVA
jgi:hypothetical protein